MSSDTANQGYVLELKDISKSFSSNQVLTSVTLSIKAGEVLGLLGENGAGKSTLIKILNGTHLPDSGTIRLRGEEITFSSPLEAIARGIATVHQESSLSPSLTVGANLLLGQEATLGRSKIWLNKRALHKAAEAIRDRSGLPIDLDRTAEDLSVGERQMVEIARGLALATSILVLDEPTAALTPSEIDVLFDGIRRISALGVAVIFVTHRLQEVPRICDRVIVLRDGKETGEVPASEATEGMLVSLMLGRQITAMFPERRPPGVEETLTATNVTSDAVHGVSLHLRRGEVLGITGVLGGGQREVARTIYGANPRRSGTVTVNGVDIKSYRPDQSIAAGMVYVSGDRQTDGVMPDLSVERSLTLPELRTLTTGLPVPRGRLRRLADSLRETFSIKAASLDSGIMTLSGGNQQKVMIARWMSTPPQVLILDEPTLGVDVGSKSEIYQLIDKLKAKGTAVLLVSSESQEILGLSDRIIVMRNGTPAAELDGRTATEADVLTFALGVDATELATFGASDDH